MMFPFKREALRVPYLECGMCDLPALYQCQECQECLHSDEQMKELPEEAAPKRYIGSGEDFCMEMFKGNV